MEKDIIISSKIDGKISKKTFLETIKTKQFEDFNEKLSVIKEKHRKARKSATLMKSELFALIKETMEVENNLLKIQDLCLLADVSRSGYYNWVKSEPIRDLKDERDAKDFALVQEAFNYRGYPKGARSIHMYLLHQPEPVLMNVKKIERLMRKFNMKFELKGNGVNRKISQMAISGRSTPAISKVALPEVTGRRQQFLLMAARHHFPNDRVGYMICIVDTFTKQILAHMLDARDKMDLVKTTLEKFKEIIDCDVKEVLYENSGKLETLKISDLMKKKTLREYVLDNAFDAADTPQEHLFGFIRDEVNITAYGTSYDGRNGISDWIDYYNKDRYVWDFGKLSPDEYDLFLKTSINPLQK